MKIHYGFNHIPKIENPVVTVGSFDGVHAGHRKLLDRVKEIAAARLGESVVVTFHPHPRLVLAAGGNMELLTTLKEKAVLLEGVGVDHLVIIPFTKEFSQVSSRDFIADYLVGRIGVSTLVIGFNHHFGRNKSGNFDSLSTMGTELGFDIFMVERQDVGSEKVSSTVIRGLIRGGLVREAGQYLGHPYFMIMRHEAGAFVTDEPDKLLPQQGIYPVTVEGAAFCNPAELYIDCDRRIYFDMDGDTLKNGDFIVTF